MIAIKDWDVVDGRELNGMEWNWFELNKSCIISTHRSRTLNRGGRGSLMTPKMKQTSCWQGLGSGLHSKCRAWVLCWVPLLGNIHSQRARSHMETWSSVPRTLDSGEPQMPWGLQSEYLETSLAVQWLRFGAFIARGLGSVPGQGTKIPQASLCSQKKKKKKRFWWPGPRMGAQAFWPLMSFPPSQHPSVAWGFLPYENSRAP